MQAANRYEILSKLAVGGMAEIFLARSTTVAGVQRYVVLKRILGEYAKNAEFVQMFLDEARLASQLQHPNIAQVFDVGKLGDSYFFTMEHVHGETVRAVLQYAYEGASELPLPFILTVVAGAAAALHHAHDRVGVDGRPLGIVHRDISPANIMVGYEGTVKLVDFGVAKATSGAHETRAGTVKGKVSYMSPEQCRGNVVDRRTDLFALGILMWELLTRGRLYRRASDFDSMAAIVNEPPPPPSTYRTDTPPDLDRIVQKLLEKDPSVRYQTGEELVDDLERTATRLGLAMNPSSIRGVLRELFGKKPEPWLMLDPQVPAITLTATPPPVTDDLGHDELDSTLDLYSAIEIASAPDLPLAAPPPTGKLDPALRMTTPLERPGTGDVESLLSTMRMRPQVVDPDAEGATTRDTGSPLARLLANDPRATDGPTDFDEDEQLTMRDEPFKFPPSRKTKPMGSVVAPTYTAPPVMAPAPLPSPPAIVRSPPNIFVSPSIEAAVLAPRPKPVAAAPVVAAPVAALEPAASTPNWVLIAGVVVLAVICGLVAFYALR